MRPFLLAGFALVLVLSTIPLSNASAITCLWPSTPQNGLCWWRGEGGPDQKECTWYVVRLFGAEPAGGPTGVDCEDAPVRILP